MWTTLQTQVSQPMLFWGKLLYVGCSCWDIAWNYFFNLDSCNTIAFLYEHQRKDKFLALRERRYTSFITYMCLLTVIGFSSIKALTPKEFQEEMVATQGALLTALVVLNSTVAMRAWKMTPSWEVDQSITVKKQETTDKIHDMILTGWWLTQQHHHRAGYLAGIWLCSYPKPTS